MNDVNYEENGFKMYDLIKNLFPICRSITGNGVRNSLNIIKKEIPIEIFEVPSGSKVFDWTVPREWNINDAYVKNSKGEKVIDFSNNNLHILNYSIPIKTKLNLQSLKNHLHTLPDHPDWIPYLTTYYNENWGFCLSHNQYLKLEEDEYEVVIDSSLEDGSLTYGELFLPGESEEEFLITCYICHPSMCNDNLSGVSLVTYLAKALINQKLKYSYRFLFIPETIGAIVWLNKNEKNLSKIKFGLVATFLAGPGTSTYKKSRQGNALIDKIVEKVLQDTEKKYQIIDFNPLGSDERQFCSPGFNLPVGSLLRSYYYETPEYHTSADNLEFISIENLSDSFKKYYEIIQIVENNHIFLILILNVNLSLENVI